MALGAHLQSSLSLRLHFLPCHAPKFARLKLFYRNITLSTEPATSVSDDVSNLLRDYGFSSDQVESVLQRQHKPLSAYSKQDHFFTPMYSQPELTDPQILEERLIHNLNLLKSLLGSVDLVKKTVLKFSRLLRLDLKKFMIPNLETLRANGVPSKLIIYFIVDAAQVVAYDSATFASVVEQVKSLGFDPSSSKFIVAMKAKIILSHNAWERKMKLYKSYGWSDENLLSAFLKYPGFMLISEKKIKKTMDLYVDKLGWDPVFLSEQPQFVLLGTETRLIPMCSVLNVLAERGLLVGGKTELHRIFVLPRTQFEERYINMYKERVPEIVEAYEKRLEQDFEALRLWQERTKQMSVLPRNAKLLVSSQETDCSEENAEFPKHRRYNPTLLAEFAALKRKALNTLLLGYGFSVDQIEYIINRQKNILKSTPDTIIKAKLDYLLDFGYSKSELVGLVFLDPNVLLPNLERRIVPNLNFLKTLLGSRDVVKEAVFHCPELIRYNLEKFMIPNLDLLKENGVPSNVIVYAIMHTQRTIVGYPLGNAIKQIKNMGFDPCSTKFIMAVTAKVLIPENVWEKRVKLYKSFGWSEENLVSAFRNIPNCMVNSDRKIKKMMEFYVNELGWDPVFLSEKPLFVGLALENRVIPRCNVLNVLAERGFLGEEMELHRMFLNAERLFQTRFVEMYKDRVPEVIEAYKSRVVKKDLEALRLWQQRYKQNAVSPRQTFS